jgi:hypothetical protein
MRLLMFVCLASSLFAYRPQELSDQGRAVRAEVREQEQAIRERQRASRDEERQAIRDRERAIRDWERDRELF